MFSGIINWFSNIKNTFFRKVLEFLTGIDKRAILPKYNSETFSNYFKKFKQKKLAGEQTKSCDLFYLFCKF